MKRRAPTAVARLVCAEIVASEAPERCRSTFLESVCFCANSMLDYIDFVLCWCCLPTIVCSITLACVLLSCFTGTHFDKFDRSGVSLAIISVTTSALMERGARPARPFTHFSNSFLLFLAPSFLHRRRSLRCFTGYYFIDEERSWLADWLAGWLTGCLAGWSCGWLVCYLAGRLAG